MDQKEIQKIVLKEHLEKYPISIDAAFYAIADMDLEEEDFFPVDEDPDMSIILDDDYEDN